MALLRRLAPIAGLLLLPFAFYWKLFAWDPSERRIFRGDFLNQHFVWKSYALSRIKEGEVPLWNPHVLGGVAFHANPQVGLFYPPNYALLAFHHEGRVSYLALEAFQLLHQALAGIGMWLFLRSLGLGTAAAWTGALVAMFTGFFTTPGHHALALTASWIPLVLYLTGRAVGSKGLRSVAALAVGVAMLLLAGHPQPAYCGLLLAGAWALYRGRWKIALRRFAPAVGLALCLAAVQILPTYELARDSSREGLGYDYATTFDFSAFFLAGALLPRGQVRLAGQDPSAALHVYVGIGTLLLAAVGVLVSRNRLRWFFAVLAAVALLLAMGDESFLFDIAYLIVPGFGRFRMAYRLLGLYTLAMAALAALGIESLLRLAGAGRRRLVVVLQGAFGLLVVLAAWSAYVHTRLVVSPGVLEPNEVERLAGGSYWTLVLLVLNTVLLLAFLWRSMRVWPAWAMIALLAVDLGSFVKDRGLHPWETLGRTGERAVADLLRAQNDRGRYVTDSNLESYSMLHRTEFAGGQDSLIDGRYAGLLAASMKSANALALLNVRFVERSTPISEFPWCGPRFPSPLPLLDITPALSPVTLKLLPAMDFGTLRVVWSPLPPEATSPVASILVNRAEYVSSQSPLEVRFPIPERLESLAVRLEPGSPGLRLETLEIDGSPLGLLSDFVDVGGIKLNLHCLPRAYFVASEGPARGPIPESLECWTPLDPVAVSDPKTGAAWNGYFRNSAVRITRYEAEFVELESESPREGFVVLADTYRPGWRAEVDGNETRVLLAQKAFRAVEVPAGRHHIRIEYRPASLYAGAVLSGLALAGVIGAAGWDFRRRPSRPTRA